MALEAWSIIVNLVLLWTGPKLVTGSRTGGVKHPHHVPYGRWICAVQPAPGSMGQVTLIVGASHFNGDVPSDNQFAIVHEALKGLVGGGVRIVHAASRGRNSNTLSTSRPILDNSHGAQVGPGFVVSRNAPQVPHGRLRS